MLDDVRVENIIHPGSKEESMWVLFFPEVPSHVLAFFIFMQSHITLDYDGMGGAKLRESRHNLSELMEKEGYDYIIYKNFIEEFESKLIGQFYDAKAKP